MRARGQALMCCAVALEDVELEVEGVAALAGGEAGAGAPLAGPRERDGTLSPDLMRLFITLPGGEQLAFTAGQYINIVLDDGAGARSRSPTRRPTQAAAIDRGDVIELHVRLIPGGRFTTHVFHGMKVGDAIGFEGPLGRFTLHDSERPILFVAGATGFAPIKSILEDAFRRGVRRPMRAVLGRAHRARPVPAGDHRSLAARARQLPFRAGAVGQPATTRRWSGRRGFVHEALLADHPDLSGYEVYACGSVRMVRGGGARLPGPRPGRAFLLLRRLHADTAGTAPGRHLSCRPAACRPD